MKKIYGLYGDVHHDSAVVKACLRGLFGDEIILLENPDELPWGTLREDVLLYVSMKENQTTPDADGNIIDWITPEREAALWDFVHAGGAALFIHNGLVGFEGHEKYHALAGGMFVTHPPLCEITYAPLGEVCSLNEGVEPFSGPDEKYACAITAPEASFCLCGQDPVHPQTISGWYQTFGAGRTAAVTPGHTFEIVEHPQMQKLLRNAADWVLNK